MNEWWHLAMKQSHLSLETERKEMKVILDDTQSKMETALLQKEQSIKSLESLSLAKDELAEQLNELLDEHQIKINDITRIDSENVSLKKEQQKLNKQINLLETNHKEALMLSYEGSIRSKSLEGLLVLGA